jgi:hypothetical protein
VAQAVRPDGARVGEDYPVPLITQYHLVPTCSSARLYLLPCQQGDGGGLGVREALKQLVQGAQLGHLWSGRYVVSERCSFKDRSN